MRPQAALGSIGCRAFAASSGVTPQAWHTLALKHLIGREPDNWDEAGWIEGRLFDISKNSLQDSGSIPARAA